MTPNFSNNNTSNGTSINLVNFCKFVDINSVLSIFSNFMNFIFGQFTVAVLYAISLSIFLNHVCRILLSGAKEKVIRVYTQFNIAMMTYIKTFWNFSKLLFISPAMNIIIFTFPPNGSVATFRYGTRPQPTFIKALHEFTVTREVSLVN